MTTASTLPVAPTLNAPPPDAPEMERATRIFGEHGVTFVGPPLPAQRSRVAPVSGGPAV